MIDGIVIFNSLGKRVLRENAEFPRGEDRVPENEVRKPVVVKVVEVLRERAPVRRTEVFNGDRIVLAVGDQPKREENPFPDAIHHPVVHGIVGIVIEIDHGGEKFAIECLPILTRKDRSSFFGNAELRRFRFGETREAHAGAETDERDKA